MAWYCLLVGVQASGNPETIHKRPVSPSFYRLGVNKKEQRYNHTDIQSPMVMQCILNQMPLPCKNRVRFANKGNAAKKAYLDKAEPYKSFPNSVLIKGNPEDTLRVIPYANAGKNVTSQDPP